MDKITDWIEEIFDRRTINIIDLLFQNSDIKTIGKSSVKPECYRQIARYLK